MPNKAGEFIQECFRGAGGADYRLSVPFPLVGGDTLVVLQWAGYPGLKSTARVSASYY